VSSSAERTVLQNIKRKREIRKEEKENETSWGTRFVPLGKVFTRKEFSCVFLGWLAIGLAHNSF
jgi:hypothetical protein